MVDINPAGFIHPILFIPSRNSFSPANKVSILHFFIDKHLDSSLYGNRDFQNPEQD